ncbi:amino acid adenylation domain-containing protein, partial [Shimazuella sp. AN120528]|uniref:non-ribosomal peptide synthetase n=1 Tax=Shimazuella soli TaxID=1892854 RepID=UPI001F108641
MKPKQLFAHQTIATLAQVAQTEAPVVGEQGSLSGEVPFVPIQKWFLEQTEHPHHFNQSMLLKVGEAKEAWLRQTIREVVKYHDALRMRFVPTETGWKQYYQAESKEELEVVDLRGEDHPLALLEKRAEEAQASLHLSEGPVFRAIWFRLSEGEGRLFLVAHHLVMDGVSWRIILEDIETIYQQLAANKPVQLPQKTSSYRQWAEHLQKLATSEGIESARTRWETVQTISLPLDKTGDNTEQSVDQVQIVFSPEETESIIETTVTIHASLEEVLLTGLVQSLQKWTGNNKHTIHLEGHGRDEIEGINLSRTVGWFTSLYPVNLTAQGMELTEVLRQTKECFREVNKQGLTYGLLRYLHPNPIEASKASISFNYLGKFVTLSDSNKVQLIRGIADEKTGKSSTPSAIRPHLIDVVAVVIENKLQITLLYSNAIFHKATMTDLLRQIRITLQELEKRKIDKYALSDFPLARLQPNELAEINGKELEFVYPLSPLQNGMLFHSLYQHGGSEYVVQIGFVLEGNLNLDVYRKAWQTLIERNPVLRTTFLWEGLSIPHQLVYRTSSLSWKDVDLREYQAEDQEKWIEEYVKLDREQGFDVQDGPLSRVYLIRLAKDVFQVIWSYHHLLIDGWSMPLLLNELMSIYEAMLKNEPILLPTSRPFADYMKWIAEQDREEAKEYWQKQLEGYDSPVQLSVLDIKKDTQRESGELSTSLSEQQTVELIDFCRDHHLTLHTLLQGTWSLLLKAFSGKTDLVYGTTVSGRPAELRGVETMVGMMINTLPVRVTIPSGQAILTWLSRLQKSFQEMRQFEYCSLVEIQQWSDFPGNENLFDYLFVFENYPVKEQSKEAELSMRLTHGKEEIHYPLTLVAGADKKLHFKWMYHKNQFSLPVIQQLQTCFVSFLEQIVSGEHKRLGDLCFTSSEEQMVPHLERLPLTADGKLDRKALLMPTNAIQEYEAPTGEKEEKLCEIWSSILEIDRLGAHDNIFQLGAHSLLVIQAVSRINREFQVKLPLQVIFEHPTIRLMAAQLPAKGKEESLEYIDRSTPLPLSYAEKRLWLMHQLLKKKEAYNVPVVFERKEGLDLSAWQFSLEQMMIKHEILRTSYVEEEENVQRVISKEIKVPLSIVESKEQLHSIANEPFDLATPPLWRTAITKDLKQCLFVMHHIITDGWSFDLFFTELCSFYQAVLAKKWKQEEHKLLQYADYAAWQETQDLDTGYWQKQLADLPVLSLPTDYPRPKVRSSCGAAVSLSWDKEFWQSIRSLANESDATLFMTLLAIFQVLLHRYSGQQDIAVGTPVANREHVETEKMIGFFVNTLVMRGDLTNNPTFRSFVQQIRQTALDAYRHQSIPFEKVVEEIAPERSLDYSPLFQVMFTLQEKKQIDRMGFVAKELPITTAKYDISLSIGEHESGADLVCEYDADLFNRQTMERLCKHLTNLARELVSDPDQRVGEVSFLTLDEQAELLQPVQNSYHMSVLPIQERIKYQAISAPTAIAMEDGDNLVCYRELNQKANQLAHYLRQHGVMAGDFVGICMERSADLVISALAVLKLGAAYVPIDPAYPESRIMYLVEDAKLGVVLSHSKRRQKMGTSAIYLDEMWDKIKHFPTDEMEMITPETDLAYMIYTSGSTGLPKGVMVSHESLLHLVEWHCKAYAITPLDRTTLLAGPAFDASVWEIWPTLASGGTLVVPSEETKVYPEKLKTFLLEKQISVSFVPTPLLESLLVLDWPTQVSLRYLLTGGEALRIYPPENFPVSVVNHYGPTENTVVSTAVELKQGIYPSTPPIGKPIDYVTAFVLDAHGNPVPTGVVGELCVGGPGLAAGYYNRPGLTAEKFISHPAFGRLYRTGDQVKRLGDGNLQFLGRFDRQVKIRGFRIELGEIEASLRQLDSVSDTVVLEQMGQLIAYVVPSRLEEFHEMGLRNILQEKLPSYMVPTHFATVEEIPLTANGKIDRSKLPEVSFSQVDTYVAPQSEEEKQVVAIWEDVLEVKVGLQDNFFLLGGHSLLAAKVIARMNQLLPYRINLRQLFETPTIAGILASAKEIDQHVQFQRKERPAKIPLSSAQERLWIYHQLQPDSIAYHIPLAMKLTGELQRKALEKAFQAIVDRHESLRTTFYEEQGKVYQAIRPKENGLMLQVCSADEAIERIKQDVQTPFDLLQDSLYRAYLYQTDHQVFVLYINLHHIIADGWSIRQLLQELWMAYIAICQEQTPLLPTMPIQYADYALQEQEWMKSEEIMQELSYWKEQLSDLPVLDLPTDHPRGQEQTFTGATYSVTLPEAVRTGLAQISHQHGMTFYMTTLAVFQTLLSRYTGATDIAVGSPVAGRSQAEWESLIGFFVNTLVFRSDLSGEPTWNEVLERVKTTAIEAYAHSSVPFERVVEEVAPDRHLSHSPLFQVMFSVENEAWQAPEVPGLTIEEVALPQTTTKFDLALHVAPWEQGMNVTFSYNTDLWEEETIARMAGHLHQL